ncbi:DUF5701 family protein [Streptomyces chartreusis]|uniref:DUF5701 family protein n=1 Tax=Streptomyces chartreusis TaxID=1969 RepID=UPI0033EE00BA
MKRNIVIATVAAAALIGGGTVAAYAAAGDDDGAATQRQSSVRIADDRDDSAEDTAEDRADDRDDRDDDSVEVRSDAAGAKVTAADAIAAALKHTPGTAVGADLDDDGSRAWEVSVVKGLDRGDRMANWSPEEALPALGAQGRTPLVLGEGIHWVLQQPAALERNHCFMTIGSRLRKADGRLDARTPAIWISNGTGRDGRERRDAPKVGWCWWGNRHTWLGFASGTGRGE